MHAHLLRVFGLVKTRVTLYKRNMLCYGILALTVALAAGAPQPFSNVLELDLTPEEAQKYLSNPPFSEPKLAGRTNVLPLIRFNDPRFRSAEAGPTNGHYWKNGHEIENTDDYVEEVYDANQFHGQDGLGAYGYGYETPESAKVENRVRSGDVAGSYTYKAGNNELIKVRYWADSQGFHQEDNIPKVELKPQEEAEDVRQARLAHEKAWQEAAAAAAQHPDPQGAYYDNYDHQASQQQNAYASNQGHGYAGSHLAGQGNSPSNQGQAGYGYTGVSNQAAQGSHGYTGAPSQVAQGGYGYAGVPNQGQGNYGQGAGLNHDYQSSASEQQGTYVAAANQAGKSYGYGPQAGYGQASQPQGYSTPKNYEEPEPTGPPRGFFYSFNYPVSIVVPKNELQGGGVNPGHPVDHDTVSHGSYSG